MSIKEIKEEMESYKDFYGGDLLEVSQIKSCKTKEDLAAIIDRHDTHLEDMLADAQSHLSHFRKRLGLEIY